MKTSIGPEIVFELGGVSSPAISPDGSVVAYVRGQVEDGKRVSWIECVAFAGGDSRRLTSGDSDSGPVWSPDGATLAFLRPGSAEDGAPRQIWLLPSDGGEARKLTDLPHSVAGFDWLPDGSGIIATVDIDPHRGRRDGSKTTVVRDTYYRGDALGYREDAWHQLFRIDAGSGAALQLTTGTYNHAHPVVSPDGRWVAFTADRNVDREQRRPFGSELCAMSTQGVAGGGHVERLTPGIMSAGKPCWSPDGSALAVSVTDMSQRHQPYLERIERYSGKRTRLTDDTVNPQTGFFPIAGPPTMVWAGDEITFAGDARGRSGVYRVRSDGSEPTHAVRSEAELINGFDVSDDGQSIAIVSTTPDAPGEVVTFPSPPAERGEMPKAEGGSATVLTRSSAHFVDAHEIGEVELFSVERDGWEIPCGLVYPPRFDPAKTYPLVMEIHGGPNGFFGEGFNVLHQVIAGAGYLVLFVNPRGSSTYGAKFTDAVTVDWGGEDSLDLLHALDVVCERPYVDVNRLGVHGYSYGGYMTTWLVGHDHRFKAAVAGAPVVNLWSMWGVSDIGPSWGSYQWGDVPDDNFDWYRERSPITYVQNVQCPVLILHGEHDWRVPISQGEEYFAGLRYRGKTAEMVRFPGCSHLMMRVGDPALVKEYYERMVAWFDRYV
ncbi:MAG: S9 family peptidase [Chloroflexi bacterium]|nr:S9 family peptidase [Chloroflexota bacterium]